MPNCSTCGKFAFKLDSSGLCPKCVDKSKLQKTNEDIALCEREMAGIRRLQETLESSDDIVNSIKLCSHIIIKCRFVNAYIKNNAINFPKADKILGQIVEKQEDLIQEVENKQSNYRCIHTKVVGVTYNNDDGSSRQEIISYLDSNEEIQLIASEYDGEPSIIVQNSIDETIGHISRELASDIYEYVTNENIKLTIVRNITGSEETTLGCNVLIVYSEC